VRPHRLQNLPYELLSFASGYAAPSGLPGAARWEALADDEVRAYMFRHRHSGKERPWLISLHGHLAGEPLDLRTMRAAKIHRRLGVNVLHPVLAFHGPRRLRRRSGEGFLGLDHLHNVNAFSQLVWDVRRCIRWVRQQGAPGIALHGVSLGAFTAALVAGLEEDIDCVIAGVPFTSAAWAVHRRLPRQARAALPHSQIAELYSVLDVLVFSCLVAPAGRFIYAGVVDRITPPANAIALWRHWDRPDICWYGGSHVMALSSPKVRAFVEAALESRLTGRA
jgi:dienelactone hydrolase